MHKRQFVQTYRLVFGVLALTAISVQLHRHVGLGFNTVNFFSYFTNLSNIIASLVLLSAACITLGGNTPNKKSDILRGAGTLYMAVTGIIFSLLLRNQDLGSLYPWVNLTLHYIMPVVVVADWFYAPVQSKVSLKDSLYWLTFPIVYLAYSLIRGPIAHFYPYPFLNPSKAGGYLGVTAYCIGILVLFLGLAWVLRKLAPKK